MTTPSTPTTPTTPMASEHPAAQGTTASQPANFVERLANQVATRAGAASLFGTPIERGGVTVVPVARASWGFGGGSGTQGDSRGSGGGGGVSVRPVGYIELKNGQAVFRPIFDPNTVLQVAALLSGALAAGLMLRLIGRLVRGK